MEVLTRPLNGWPCLVLNADFRPLSYYPLSLWSWQEAIKNVFLERVNIVAEYEAPIRSPSFEMRAPSVVSLKDFVHQDRPPAFTELLLSSRDIPSAPPRSSGRLRPARVRAGVRLRAEPRRHRRSDARDR